MPTRKGNLIAYRRRRLGLTWAQLAILSGYSEEEIMDAEKSRFRPNEELYQTVMETMNKLSALSGKEPPKVILISSPEKEKILNVRIHFDAKGIANVTAYNCK